MNAAERLKEAEDFYQRLTGTQPDYATVIQNIGKVASVSDKEGDVFWQANIVKQYETPQQPGIVSSLKLITKQILPPDIKSPRARDLTMIDYLRREDTDLEARIKEAIYAQDNIRQTIDNMEEEMIVGRNLFQSDDVLAKSVDGCVNVRFKKYDREGNELKLPFAIYDMLGREDLDKSRVRVEATDYRMRDIIPIIDLQIKKLNGALTNPVKVPIEL
jgi:hypothetical protein